MKQFLNNKKILFFSPNFLGYDQVIKKGLEDQGADVSLYDERPSDKSVVKALIRINPSVYKPFSKKYFIKVFEKEKHNNFDYIFVIKGEALTSEIIYVMKDYFINSKLIFYTWDSLRNVRDMDKKIFLYDRVFSFDRGDCNTSNNISYLPLFFPPCYDVKIKDSSSIKKINDLIFIASLHSDRYKVLNKILSNVRLGNSNISFYCFLFYPSKFFFCLRKLFDKNFFKLPIKHVKWRALSQADVLKKIQQSKIVIDINHPKQSGLTMRTIECLALRKKLITTNRNIIYEGFYNESNILIIDRNNPSVPLDFIDRPYQEIDINIINNYSLDTWISRIFYD